MKITPTKELNTVYPWMRVVSARNEIKENVTLRVWQLWAGSITNLKSKPGTSAARFVTPSGVLTDKGRILGEELELERMEYLRQKGNQG